MQLKVELLKKRNKGILSAFYILLKSQFFKGAKGFSMKSLLNLVATKRSQALKSSL